MKTAPLVMAFQFQMIAIGFSLSYVLDLGWKKTIALTFALMCAGMASLMWKDYK